MTDDIAIKVENLIKVYHLYNKPQDRFKEALNPFKKSYHHNFHAVNDVSFEIKKGETVGIIGKNGAGKSTLLKMITGVLTPTSGSIQVNGKIASLLELGAGFNPEMTGMENIYLNGTLMGFSKKEMDSKIDAILEFADIGEFIYQAVKVYSSGMFARLAFSVAINVEPDILIVDEVLSVGDARFQSKSIKRMEEIQKSGSTILFVSHAIEQVKRFCSKSIWIDNGNVKMRGNSAVVGDKYMESLHLTAFSTDTESDNEQFQVSLGVIGRIYEYKINKSVFKSFEQFSVKVGYEVFDDDVSDLLIGVAIYDNNRNYIFGPNTYLEKFNIDTTKGRHVISYTIPSMSLLSGEYLIDIGLFTDKGLVNLDYHKNVLKFNIENEYFTEGVVYLEHNWNQHE